MLLGLVGTGTAQAAWYGAVGNAVDKGQHALEFAYSAGKRDLVPDEGGPEQELSSRGLFLQYARGLGQGFEFLLRGTPSTGRIGFSGTSFNPEVWGAGGGLHWAPPEPLGPVRLGLLATVDYMTGSESEGNNLNWIQMDLAAGLSVPLPRDLSVTGGITYSKADVDLKLNGVKWDADLAKNTGGFAGIGWSPNPAWNVSTEVHFGVEQVWGLSARYNFQ